ncbi:aspartyl/asparaginyl beta-hydroxylase isoform X9 [Meleagris gallopavo]|uniref:aspartyl/asparaginyl beta-hydroxylase isoform X9 n=1 Tax=Meleagris gallopavo TaxID=9103 RepID=UPI0012AC12D6|nr:aspartyl/asparaginyl beta-hydroxylase isoform X9 [Meleagris gallopavo]
MASRKGSKGTGGTPGPGSKRESKHGGNKNGKKEGLSGSSFFTWFMVIALLGVWTSVAVVWFELVDYEEVLAKAKDFRYNLSEVLQGKLGIYDADGDGDFDVEDAKVLLGEEPGGVAKKKAKVKVKETIAEPLKKLKEKQESKKEGTKDEEDKKKARKGKDAAERKEKKAVDTNKLKKESEKVKKDRGKEKEKVLEKNVKPKETTKKQLVKRLVLLRWEKKKNQKRWLKIHLKFLKAQQRKTRKKRSKQSSDCANLEQTEE